MRNKSIKIFSAKRDALPDTRCCIQQRGKKLPLWPAVSFNKALALISVILLISGCGWEEIPERTVSAASSAEAVKLDITEAAPETTAPPPSLPPEPEEASVTLICAGDNLIHSSVFKQAAAHAGGNGYDFLPIYEDTAELIAGADLAILNQETVVSDDFEPSGYPSFCSPAALGDDMVKMGFDAFSLSNNHILDKGGEGLRSTLGYWRERQPQAIVYGASFKGEDNIATAEINGITFAFVGFMEHTNGISLPADSDCKITYLNEKEEVERQVRAAAEAADCVIASVHYGIEVSNTVTQEQLDVTRELVDWGADIIIGTQPHTVQQMEYIEKEDGGRAFVFYCLGNYISTMDEPLAMVGYLGRLNVVKDMSTGKITLSDPEAIPIIDHYAAGGQNVRVYRWSNYTPELAEEHVCPGFSYSMAEELIEKYAKYEDLLD